MLHCAKLQHKMALLCISALKCRLSYHFSKKKRGKKFKWFNVLCNAFCNIWQIYSTHTQFRHVHIWKFIENHAMEWDSRIQWRFFVAYNLYGITLLYIAPMSLSTGVFLDVIPIVNFNQFFFFWWTPHFFNQCDYTFSDWTTIASVCDVQTCSRKGNKIYSKIVCIRNIDSIKTTQSAYWVEM